MEASEFKETQDTLEHKFFEMLNNNEDIRIFLYFPYEYLTEPIKDYLDKFLLIEAYKHIKEDRDTFVEKFVVYDDGSLVISLKEFDKQIELLDKLKKFFIENEEYEKCTDIQYVLEKIKGA